VHANPSETATLAVPHIEIDTLVPCAPDAAFEYFTRDIGRWWPLARYSCGMENSTGVFFEDGKLIETDRSGKRHVWGSVTARKPGRRVALTWHPGLPAETAMNVEVTFDAAGDSTRVKLVHTGFERLGDQGASTRAQYAGGWPAVIGQVYRGYCEKAA